MEGRPSVLQNDIVYVWEPDDTEFEYEVITSQFKNRLDMYWDIHFSKGYVHSVGQDYVLLMLCLDFHRRFYWS